MHSAEGGEDGWVTERSEFHVELKPGLSGAGQDEVEQGIQKVLDSYPGRETELLTFRGDRIGESLSGETAALAIGVYGADLDTLDATAQRIRAVLDKIPGATDVALQTPPRTPVVRLDLDLRVFTRYGLSPVEALAAVQAAYQGVTPAQIYSDDRTTDIAVTTQPELRDSPRGGRRPPAALGKRGAARLSRSGCACGGAHRDRP